MTKATARREGVDLWYLRTDSVRSPKLLAACLNVMSVDEQERGARFVFDKHRHEYLLTRGLARGVLARYASRAPGDLRFLATEYGRPILADGGDLRFNLTNTPELIACAVARGTEIGVDAEPLCRGDEILRMSLTVFTADERAALLRAAPTARTRHAVELWTLKEAYIKARGLGLNLPLDRFQVELSSAPRLTFFAPVDDAASRWSLATFEREGHFLSVCAETEASLGVEVRVRCADLDSLLTS